MEASQWATSVSSFNFQQLFKFNFDASASSEVRKMQSIYKNLIENGISNSMV